ncbi:MAG: hypothetical protein KGL39_06250 [Patescibacteria group bacterium]|nr:hypothetical protein [Patescibacteria group bacterium]
MTNCFTNAMRGHGVVTFDDYGQALEFLFGPPQHDAHVGCYRGHKRAEETKANYARIAAEWDAKVKQYGSISAWRAAEPVVIGSGK